MGMWENDFEAFCPICNKVTEQTSYNDNDDTGTHTSCYDCEHELPLPKLTLESPFMIGDTVYLIQQGSDEWRLSKYHD